MGRLYPMLFFALFILTMSLESMAATPSTDKHLQQSKGTTEPLKSDIDALRKDKQTLDLKLYITSQIGEAKWDLYLSFIGLIVASIILMIGSGYVVRNRALTYLQDSVDRDISGREQTIQKNMDDQLTAHKKKTDEDLGIHTKELNSRIWGTQGLILINLLEAYEEKSDQWKIYWKAAEDHIRQGLGEAEKLPENDPKWEERVCIIKNNLAFLLIVDGMSNKREEAIKLSQYVYEKASKYSDGYHFEDTYGWALLVFAQNEQEKTTAVELLNTVYDRPTLPQGWVQGRKAKLEKFLR